MAYGDYNYVDFTVKTAAGEKYLFHAEPLSDEKSGGSGSITLKDYEFAGIKDAGSVSSLCEMLLACLDMPELEDYDIGSADGNSRFHALSLLARLEMLQGAERLGTVYENYRRFASKLEQEIASIDQIRSVECRESDRSWGWTACERFGDFMGELGFEYEDWEAFEEGGDEEDEHEEAVHALEEKLDRLIGGQLVCECPKDDIIDCCQVIFDNGPRFFSGQRIYTLDMLSGTVRKTWRIQSCEA